MTRSVKTRSCAAFRGFFATDAARIAFTICIVVGILALAHVLGLVLCPLKRLFGIPCPTCGSTRAMLLLLRGNVHEAFAMQPMAIMATCLILPTLLVLRASLGKCRAKAVLATIVRNRLFWLLAAVAILSNWAYVICRGN